MLKRFPGRTLEELDGMDWFRFMRAVEAESVQELEDKRGMQIAGKLKATDMKASDWERVREHDALLAEWGSDGD